MNKLSGNMNTDVLLKIASAKLNMDPEVLKKQLQEGKFDETLRNMNPKDAAKFQQVLKNPAAAEKLVSSAQAKEMYRKIMDCGKETGGK